VQESRPWSHEPLLKVAASHFCSYSSHQAVIQVHGYTGVKGLFILAHLEFGEHSYIWAYGVVLLLN
jgi:hypothetical protein